MIIRGIPNDIENYVCVRSLVSEVLHMCGFQPRYIDDDDNIYYKKTQRLESFMREEGLKCEKM